MQFFVRDQFIRNSSGVGMLMLMNYLQLLCERYTLTMSTNTHEKYLYWSLLAVKCYLAIIFLDFCLHLGFSIIFRLAVLQNTWNTKNKNKNKNTCYFWPIRGSESAVNSFLMIVEILGFYTSRWSKVII